MVYKWVASTPLPEGSCRPSLWGTPRLHRNCSTSTRKPQVAMGLGCCLGHVANIGEDLPDAYIHCTRGPLQMPSSLVHVARLSWPKTLHRPRSSCRLFGSSSTAMCSRVEPLCSRRESVGVRNIGASQKCMAGEDGDRNVGEYGVQSSSFEVWHSGCPSSRRGG